MATNERHGVKYPRTFESGLMDIGSRTTDSGHSFDVTVDEDGFHLTRTFGVMSVGDLFGELSYWPKRQVWRGTATRLDDLLRKLAEENGIQYEDVLDAVSDHFETEEIDIRAYIKVRDIATAGGAVDSPEGNALRGTHQVRGLPSPEIRENSFYNGVELDLTDRTWSAALVSDRDDLPEVLIDTQSWDFETFSDLVRESESPWVALPWSGKEAHGQRADRGVQREAEGRVPERALVPESGRREVEGRGLASALQ